MSDDIAVFGLRGRVDQGASPRNTLVVDRIETTTPFSGLRLIEDGYQIQEAIKNKDWLSGSLAGAAMAGDTMALLFDPIGTAVAMGVGWLLDHVSPLKEWLNELTGDAGAVAGAAATWVNIGNEIDESAHYVQQSLKRLNEMKGETVRAAIALHADLAEHLKMASGMANSMALGLELASSIVQVVHDLVRDAIADIVGSFASAAITAVATVGTGIPKVIADVALKVAKWSAKLGHKIQSLIKSFLKLSGLMKLSESVFARLAQALDKSVKGRDVRKFLDGVGQHLVEGSRREDVWHSVEDLATLRGRRPHEFYEPLTPPRETRPFEYPTEIIKEINPRFGTPLSRMEPELQNYLSWQAGQYVERMPFDMNCMDCSRSFESTWRGQFNEAAGRRFGGGEYPDGLTEWARDPHISGFDPKNLSDTLKAGGHGSSAIVLTQYMHQGDQVGHAYNVVNHQGSILVVDAQIGLVKPLDMQGLHPGLEQTLYHHGMVWGKTGERIG